MGRGNKLSWRILFHRTTSAYPTTTKKHTHIQQQQQQPPKEFICQISNTIMSDPVIVSSGHTFERNAVEACLSLSFIPTLPDGSSPDFSALIPNLALKTTILNWSTFPPKPLDFRTSLTIVHQLKNKSIQSTDSTTRSDTESNLITSSSSGESVTPVTTLPLTTVTRPFSYSSSSLSEDAEPLTSNGTDPAEAEELMNKISNSETVFEQKEALILLRQITRTEQTARISYCTTKFLTNLRSLITSRYADVQENSVALLVNISLEDANKVKIVRAGIVPPLIDVLSGGFSEAQEHAAAALFSLALDDQNKTAIGVLGALPPIMHALRSVSEQARNDSALALYHLTLVESNRAKLVKSGSVSVLLDMVRAGHMTGRVLLVLGNLGCSAEGRAAMLNGGAVGCFVGMLRSKFDESEMILESFVAVLHGLSCGGLRFKGLAKEAGAEEVLRKVVEVCGSKRAKEKTRRMLEVLSRREEGEEESVDWEKLLEPDEVSRTGYQLVYGGV